MLFVHFLGWYCFWTIIDTKYSLWIVCVGVRNEVLLMHLLVFVCASMHITCVGAVVSSQQHCLLQVWTRFWVWLIWCRVATSYFVLGGGVGVVLVLRMWWLPSQHCHHNIVITTLLSQHYHHNILHTKWDLGVGWLCIEYCWDDICTGFGCWAISYVVVSWYYDVYVCE